MNSLFLIYCVKLHLEEGVCIMHKVFTWFTVAVYWIKRETSAFQTRQKCSFDSSGLK